MKSFVVLTNILPDEPSLELNDTGYIVSRSGEFDTVLFMRTGIQTTLHNANFIEFDIEKTGDEFTKKMCDRCFKLLPTETNFSNNRIKKGGKITKRPSCKDCRKIKDGKSISKTDREIWDAKKPNEFTPFTCPICQKTTIVGVSHIVLDHCHKTGEVRGHLCESCNTGIGRFDDNPDLVERAKQWLLRSL